VAELELVSTIPRRRDDPSSGLRRGTGQGAQSLVEFALIFPVLCFVLFAVLEGSLALFTIDTARYSAGEAGRQDAQSANAANADTAAVQLIRTGPMSATSLATVAHIDIYRLAQQSNGQLAVDNAHYNSYRLDGTAISVTWPPSTRNVSNGTSDFIGLTIYFQYNWLSGRLLASGPLTLTQTFDFRIEPQTY
jgi:Flp pilus assembly protein TadG